MSSKLATAIREKLRGITGGGDWRACHDGECICGQVWSMSADTIVAMPNWDDELGPSVLPTAQHQANAKLIAAAPNLLARSLVVIEAAYAELAAYDAWNGVDAGDDTRKPDYQALANRLHDLEAANEALRKALADAPASDGEQEAEEE